MKHSTRNLAALGLAALTALPMALRAEEMGEADMKVWRESVDERLKGLNNELVEFNKVRFDAFVNLRYDDVRKPGVSVNQNVSSNSAGNGLSGIYARRAEGKFSGLLTPMVTYSLGFDFAENKMKDVGIEVKELPLIPFFDSGQTWDLRVGQYRIPFGIVPQTSSSAIYLPERPMVYGGSNNIGGTRIVGERVMGLQGRHKAKLGFTNTDLQFAALNNTTEDQTAGQNRITDSNGNSVNPASTQAFVLQGRDQDLSWVARFAFDWAFLNSLLPEKSKIQTGASYLRDSQNRRYMAQNAVDQEYDEIYGFELLVQITPLLTSQTEWVREMDRINARNGLTAQREGWYTDLVFDALPLLASEIEKGDKLDLIFRLENSTEFDTAGANRGGTMPLRSRIAGGIKWSYWGGKNNTSINYFVDGYNQNFGQTVTNNVAASPLGGPATTFIIQQQFAFENGKAKWMEKEAE